MIPFSVCVSVASILNWIWFKPSNKVVAQVIFIPSISSSLNISHVVPPFNEPNTFSPYISSCDNVAVISCADILVILSSCEIPVSVKIFIESATISGITSIPVPEMKLSRVELLSKVLISKEYVPSGKSSTVYVQILFVVSELSWTTLITSIPSFITLPKESVIVKVGI